MARKRIESEPVLKSWDEVNAHLKEIGELQIEVSDINNVMNLDLNKIKEAAEELAKPLENRIALLEKEIKEYTEAHRTELTSKSKRFTFGVVGFRQSSKIVIDNIQNTIQAIMARGMNDCIKGKPQIDRKKLANYPDETLAAVGAIRKTGECFGYDVNYEQIKAE